MKNRLLALLVSAFALCLAVAAPAAAAVYPPTPIPGVLEVTPTSPSAGESFTVCSPAGTFEPGSTVDFTAEKDGTTTDLGSAKAKADGSICKSVKLSEAGSYKLVATGTKSGAPVSYSKSVTIASSGGGGGGGGTGGGGGGGNLSSTGADRTLTIAAVGGGLVLLGGAAVVIARRRETRV